MNFICNNPLKWRIFASILLIFLFFPVILNASEQDSDLKLFNKRGKKDPNCGQLAASGIESFDVGSRATGYILLKKAYEDGCRDPIVLFKLGLYEEKREHFYDAVIFLMNASESFPKYYPHHSEAKKIDTHTARAAYMANDYLTALKYAKRALSKSDDDISTLFIASEISTQNKEWEQAIKYLQKAKNVLMVTPQSPERDTQLLSVMRLLITSYFNIKDYDQAEIVINETLYLMPNDPIALGYKKELDVAKNRKRQQEMIKKIIE